MLEENSNMQSRIAILEDTINEITAKNKTTNDRLQKELLRYKNTVLLNRGSSLGVSLSSPEPYTNRPKSSTIIKQGMTNLATKRKPGKTKILKMTSSRSPFKRKKRVSKGKLNKELQQYSSGTNGNDEKTTAA